MKYFLLCLISSALFAGPFVKDVPQPLHRAYIPTGFDNIDSIQIVAQGTFKNSCYQMGYIDSEVDDSSMEIHLTTVAYEYEGNCSEFGVPFHHVVHLGLLHKNGSYTLRDAVSKKNLGVLKVEKVSEPGLGTDAIQYAPLLDAYLDKAHRNIILTGAAPNSCFRIKEVKFLPYENVVVVLPVADYSGTDCKNGIFPYQETFPISVKLPKHPFLLHVRSSGGQSINKMVY